MRYYGAQLENKSLCGLSHRVVISRSKYLDSFKALLTALCIYNQNSKSNINDLFLTVFEAKLKTLIL